MPTSGDVLLDTSVVIEHFRRTKKEVLEVLHGGRILHLPLTALGELYTGAFRNPNSAKSLQQITKLLTSVSVICPDESTAEHFGRIHAELAEAGTPIPQNDIWIAAIAREHHLTLATRDEHFLHVRGLHVVVW